MKAPGLLLTDLKGVVFLKKSTKYLVMTAILLLLIPVFSVTVYAAGSGNVAGAVESTWKSASQQIKEVVNKVVFPAIDLILAVFFFAKLGTAYFDCAPVKAL